MSDQTTLQNSPNVISLQELEFGHTRFDVLGGMTAVEFGRALRPANLSARQAKELGLLTSGISGPPSTTSSHSAALTQSLVSRLQARTASLGSSLYKLTWKERFTPSGRSIYALRASARPTSDKGCGGLPSGWPTPQARDHFPAHTPEYIAAKKAQGHGMQNLNDHVQLAGWNTPRATDGSNGGPNQAGGALPADAALAGWTTTTRDWKDSGTDIKPRADGPERFDQLPRQANLAGWPTPLASPDRKSPRAMTPSTNNGRRSGGGQSSPPGLEQMAEIAAGIISPDVAKSGLPATWPEWTGPARLTVTGEMLTGSSAGMESGGPLSPHHSRWLMGLPPIWCECAISAAAGLALSKKKPRRG